MPLSTLIRPFFKGWSGRPNPISQYEVRGYKLDIPAEHVLPRYRADHPLYDRFLGVLGDCLPEYSLVIDIGANIGDSAAALCGIGRKRVICVEGSPHFFKLLANNAERIRICGHEIICVSAIIGAKQTSGLVINSASSGTTVVSDRGTSLTPLDQITEASYFGECPVTLVKVDTDGHDAIVLASGRQTITEHQPLLFWENEIASSTALKYYCNVYEFLQQVGYDWYTIFDNFGNIMFETNSIETVCEISVYIATLNAGISTRTIYYTDILASTQRHRALHSAAVAAYRMSYNIKPCMLNYAEC